MVKCLSTEFFQFPSKITMLEEEDTAFNLRVTPARMDFFLSVSASRVEASYGCFAGILFSLFSFAVRHLCCIVSMAYEIWRTGTVAAFNMVDIFDRGVRFAMNFFPCVRCDGRRRRGVKFM